MQHSTRISVVVTVLLCLVLAACSQPPLPTAFIITTTPRPTWTPTLPPSPTATVDPNITPSPSPTLAPTAGITVTPPLHTELATYSVSTAQLNSAARFLLYNNDPKATTSALIRLSPGAITFIWTGNQGNRKNLTQRIILTPRLNQGGILALDVYSATENGAKIDPDQTILGPEVFRTRSFLALVTKYNLVVNKKLVTQNDTYILSRFDISASRIAVDQWLPAN